jgi:putative alpha-1,2-mannosidase
MGFYPVCPGTDQYVIGTPLFRKVSLALENGRRIEIRADNPGEQNRYIRSVHMNGASYTPLWFSHARLTEGAVIDFEMSPVPDTDTIRTPADLPYSFSDERP